MGIHHQGCQGIDHGVDDTTMPGVFDLLDVLDLVVDGFDDGFTQQPLIGHGHQFIEHVPANFDDPL